jgi:hypothetical protein
MRTRELIARLKDDDSELRKTREGGLFTRGTIKMQINEARRLMLLHALEGLLPEIIEKLQAGQKGGER